MLPPFYNGAFFPEFDAQTFQLDRPGKISQVFGSKAKEKRFADEDRLNHRSEYRKPKGLLTRPWAKK